MRVIEVYMHVWAKTFMNAFFFFSSVAQSCPTLCNPMDCSMPGFLVHHQLLELTQTHVHQVGDAIQPSHPLSPSSPPAFNLSQHQGLFQWVSSSHQVAKVLEFQLQLQSFQRNPRADLLCWKLPSLGWQEHLLPENFPLFTFVSCQWSPLWNQKIRSLADCRNLSFLVGFALVPKQQALSSGVFPGGNRATMP